MQWAGEEYLLAELEDSAKLTKSDAVYDKEVLYWIASGTLIPERIVKKSTSKPLPKP